VSAGPIGATIARDSKWIGRAIHSSLGLRFTLVFSLVGVGLAAAAFGVVGVAIFSLSVLGVGLVSPYGSLLLLAMLLLVSFVGAGIRVARRTHWLVALLPIVLLGGAAEWFNYSFFLKRTGSGKNFDPAPNAQANCVVTGFSTAGQSALRNQRNGLFDILDGVAGVPHGGSCARCVGNTELRARPGETIPIVRDAICGLPNGPGNGLVVFIGGNNDDYIGWQASGSIVAMFRNLAMTAHFIVEPRFDPFAQGWGQKADTGAFPWLGLQTAAVREMVACAHARGYATLYVHDSTAVDLEYGRSPERQKMMEARRDAVKAAGGTFFAVNEVFADQMGVAWFGDFIHLSAAAQARVADLVCATPPAGE
jgi:hypothetical protein